MPPKHNVVRWFPVLATIAAAACGGSDLTLPNEGLAAKIVVVKGDAQSATVSSVLPESLVVRVTDSRDQPVGNQRVDFLVDAGGGAVSPGSTTTGADGIARTLWTLGSTAGPQRVIARATGSNAPANLSVTFNASALTAAPAKLAKSAGDAQTAAAGAFVAIPPAVKVTDAGGNPIQGVLVTFQVSLGGGTVAPTTPVSTNASGVAAATSWKLGTTAGQNQLTATVSATGVAGNPAVFNATGAVGGANRLVFIVQPVNAAVGAPITPALKVQVQDAAGNPVSSATNPITISPGNNPTGAALSGTTTVNAVGGTATFADLSINKPGTGYTLAATSTSGLTGAISTAFDVVNASSTTTISNINPGSTVVGQPYIVTFTVAAAPPASGTPTGVVTVSDGAGATCTAQAPSGSCALTSTSAGAKSVVATYAGDANFAGSASPAQSHAVGPAATTALITPNGVSPEPSFFGQAITVGFSVTVNPPGSGTPVGNVTISYQGAGSCSAPAAAGQCSFTPTETGTRNLRATFAPSTPDWSADQSPNVAHTVNQATTSTAIGSSKNPANAGEQVSFAATVTVAAGAGTPTGTVTFRDGNATFATVTLAGNGTASASQSFTAGQHNITAQYSGDGNFAGSTSAVLQQQIVAVNAAPTAQPDNYSTNEDTPLSVPAPGVLANDTDPDNDPLTAVLGSSPQHAASFAFAANGSFSYTPDPNYNGPDSFTYHASDGTLSSNTVTVSIMVNSVNDAPTFGLAGSNIDVAAGAGAQSVPGWATGISPGPPNEATQSVSFDVSNDTPGAFGLLGIGGQPAIDESGTLTYTPNPLIGSATVTVTVVAHDNAGTANGGDDTSGQQHFTITIGP
jgi:hypothetical protein